MQCNSPEDILNADETWQLYRTLKDEILCTKSEKCRGKKRFKERLMTLLWMTEMLVDLLIRWASNLHFTGISLLNFSMQRFEDWAIVFNVGVEFRSWFLPTVWDTLLKITREMPFDSFISSQMDASPALVDWRNMLQIVHLTMPQIKKMTTFLHIFGHFADQLTISCTDWNHCSLTWRMFTN